MVLAPGLQISLVENVLKIKTQLILPYVENKLPYMKFAFSNLLYLYVHIILFSSP